MTAPALLYRPTNRWQIGLAFGCAAALYLAAIALARSVPEIPAFTISTDNGVDIDFNPTPDQMPAEPAQPTPTESSELVKPDEAFPDEKSISPVIRPMHRKPVSRLARPFLGRDPNGYRAGFIELVRKVQSLSKG